MALEKQLVTVEEFEAFIERPENADRRFELIHGEIVEIIEARTLEHTFWIAKTASLIAQFVNKHELGEIAVFACFSAPEDRLNARVPDIAVNLNKKISVTNRGVVPFIPDFVVEVQAASEKLKDLRTKARYFLANGSRLIWLVFPEKQMVEVYTLDDDYVLFSGDTLNGGDVLPGFELSVTTIFESVR